MCMNDPHQPLVSVLLPVYNCEEYLEETLNSLAIQTYKNFEIIAINDGSTDDSLAILERFQARDSRCKITSQKNQGLVASLNHAATLAKGDLLARIDGDDLALRRRFELQVKELSNHPSAVLCASAFDVMNEDGEILYHDAVPTISADIRLAMYTRNPIAHGSVMMRRQAFEHAGRYSADCGPTEDYELWTRLLEHGEFRILHHTLFRWRVNTKGITSTKADTMKRHMDKNKIAYFSKHPATRPSRQYIYGHAQTYVAKDEIRGVARKLAFFYDLTELALLFAKKRRYIDSVLLLISLMSTGRSGVRVVADRIKKVIAYHVFMRKASHG